MTVLTFRSRETCATCRCRIRGVLVGNFRVNKNSLRSLDVTLQMTEPTCPECRAPTPYAAERWALDPESEAKVAEVRARKGWAAPTN